MSAVTETLADERPRHPWRWLVALLAVLAVAGVAVAVTHPFHHSASGGGSSDNTAATSLATVSRRALAAQTQVNGTLGYAHSYAVAGQARGTVTALPNVGQVIKQGQVLYRVDGRPVVLLYGSTPAYRALSEGATASDVTGADVRQLNAALVALGYASSDDLDPTSDEFSWATKAAVEKLQSALGLDKTGALALGDIVFEPTALRVTDVTATLGAPAGGSVLTATSTTRQVSIDLDADLQSTVKDGDAVTITLPDGRTTPGRVSSVGTVAIKAQANSDSSPTIAVTVALADPQATGTLDQAPVQVAITTDTVQNALVVPVTALLALAGGGYAVEAVGADGTHRLVAVSLGLFDDGHGLVQVSGTGLAAGQRVVVPSS
jgi:putative peptidoglycan binding protein